MRPSHPVRIVSLAELGALDLTVLPVWVWSCSSGRILWANQAACQHMGRSMDALLTYRFNRLSGSEANTFNLQSQLLRDEVELGGETQLLSGFGHPTLPGVPPFCPGIEAADFLYSPLVLSLPGAEATPCTLVQMVNATVPGTQSQRYVTVQAMPRQSTQASQSSKQHGSAFSGDGRRAGHPALSISAMVDLMDCILSGRPVDLEQVESLQGMLQKGELIVQAETAVAEELAAEELDQDVGLNLLQLLGNRRGAEMFGATSTSTSSAPAVGAGGGGSLSPGGPSGSAPTGSATAPQLALVPGAVSQPSSPGPRQLRGAGKSYGSDVSDISLIRLQLEGEADVQEAGTAGFLVASSLVPAMEAVLAGVDEWRFDAFKLEEATQGHPLSALGFWLMQRAGLVHDGTPGSSGFLDGPRLARFLRKVEDSYPTNPYHNRTHAADVLQSMHVLMTRGGLVRRLGEDLGLLAGYLAACIHDLEHRGLNNDFLVRTADELAVTYNDTSPMENHHVAAAFRLVRLPQYNFLTRLPPEKMGRLRRLLIDMVLATDMKSHFAILSKFQSKLQVRLRSTNWRDSPGGLSGPHSNGGGGVGSGGAPGAGAGAAPGAPGTAALTPATSAPTANGVGSGSFNSSLRPNSNGSSAPPGPVVEDEADRSLLLQMALKCADVGHLAATWEVHHRWVSSLEEEFFIQGDREKAAGLTVSPLMDRDKSGICKSQVGFFDIVALPLFYSWAAVFHEAVPLVRAVEENCNRWRMLDSGRTSHHHSRRT